MVVEEQVHTVKNEVAGLTIKDLFFKYIRFLPLFIICVALSLFVAYIYLRYATLVYQSTGTIVIKDEKSAGSGGGDKLEQLMVSDGKKNIQNEIEFLQSRPLMERVVRALNLNFTYMAKGRFKDMNAYKISPFVVEPFELADSAATFTLNIKFATNNTFRVDNGPVLTFGQVFKNPNGVFRLIRSSQGPPNNEYNITWQPARDVAGGLLPSLLVVPKQNTGILTITMQAHSPHLAADVINQLMVEYQEATIEDKNDATRKSIAFIDSRLDVVQRELDSINRNLKYFQETNQLIDPDAQASNYFTRIEEATREGSEQMILLSNAEMIDGYLRSNQLDPVPSTLGINDPTLQAMVAGYNQAQLQRKALLENAPGGNISVQQKEQEIAILREKILESLRGIKSSYRSALGRIQYKHNVAQSQVRALPAKIQQMAEIRRAQATKLVVYNSLLQKREESAIALASTISNTKVLQDASVNSSPIKPNRRNTQMLAIIIGLVLPAMFIFVLELLNDKITTRQDIERVTNAAILGEVGHSYGKTALVVTTANRSVVAEQFRILRSNLQYVINHIPKPVVLVTSSFSGEGKSFVSTNVGAVMALAGKKTIILEFDIRKPKVLQHLDMMKRPGLTNFLLGKVEMEDLPVAVPGCENLFVLPCGPVPPNPAELLLDPKLDQLFEFLKSNFDVVIMDTAPVGMVSDAMTLSRFANCTLYIVRQGHTYKKQIALLDEFYQQKKLPKLSIVLNDVKLRTGYGYYGYGRYGYGYGYGSGYFDDENVREKSILDKWFGWMNGKKKSGSKKRKSTTV
ncbi:MAG TPA: polysaccharide biosynthesis tyrosine autokinase [Flavisolibacter sp.]